MEAKIFKKNNLVSVEVSKPSKAICDLFTGHGFPVVYENRIYIANYEPEIDAVYLSHCVPHDTIISLATSEAECIYQDAITEASNKARKLICDVYTELNSLSPPWDE